MCSLLHADQGNRHRRYRSNAQGGGGTALTIFGAICPEHGKGAGLVLPLCNTEAMTLHLAEIARTIAFGAHAVVLMDQAGWHMTGKLDVPGNISIIAIQPGVYLPRRHRRPLLRGVEQTRRSTLAHHDHRAPQMGAWVVINAGWYKLACSLC